MDGSVEFLGHAEAFERRLADDVESALGVAAVGVGEERAVLLGEEEARRDGVHADAFAELGGYFIGHEGGEIADAGFGGGVAAHAGQWTEGGHGREVDDAALLLLHHGFEEHLGGDDRAEEVEVEHTLEVFGLQVEDVAVRSDGGSGHVASGGIEQGVHTSVGGEDVAQVLLHDGCVHYVGLEEHGFSSFGLDVSHDGLSHFGFASHDDDFGSLRSQV